ncbi:type II secretion system protein M [Caulobacter sp. CCH9-E1]|uniref:type II secretion system protein M n=1 Tax=Caulobacter sp. CCH9-E1 TaxID=1768768 RepID=UPI000835641C|nr:type II secretion system protein M [Caulobacter sp. CCH9-E1]
MNGLGQAMVDWWASRTARERGLLSIMAAMLVVVIGWYGVASPLARLAADARERLERVSQQQAMLAVAARSVPKRVATQESTQAIVEASAAKAGIAIARRRQDAEGRFTIWVTAIDARQLLPWTVGLERSGSITVVEFTASRLDGGLIEAEITFAKAE